MTNSDRIAANRRNAKKSTGPKTEAGKEAVSRNALKHGLHAQSVICADESSRQYQEFAAALIADLAPADSVEEQLAQRIVTCSWRLLRMVNAEATMFDSWRFDREDSLEPGESPYSRRFDNKPGEMMALSRYESALDRALGRAYALLDRRQARRRGEHVAAPVTVLVENGPSNSIAPDSAKSLLDKADYESCGTKPNPDLAAATSRLES
jgi:hypothetical protein